MRKLFVRLENTRKRVIVKRQLSLLEKLLNADKSFELFQLENQVRDLYASRKDPDDGPRA
jgi:hypothetical protein